MPPDWIVETESLSVRLGGRTVLDRLDLRIASGPIGLLVPNGAGKTTLLRVLLGMLTPSRGRARALGLCCRRSARRIRRRVGYMPEEVVALPRRSAVESVKLLAEMSGLPAREALQRTHEALWYVGLGEARYRAVQDYSAGMRQRFKLAVALVHDPDLLYLDEPTSGLDPSGRREMLELLQDLARNHGKSLILSTHLLFDVEAVCESVLVLDRGRLIRQEPVRPIETEPEIVYQLQLSGEGADFCRRLEQQGLSPAVEGDGFQVSLPRERSTAILFQAARDAGVQVRSLQPRQTSLSDHLAAWLGES